MRIVYNSYNGRYADSPAAVHRALLGRAGLNGGEEHQHVWFSDSTRGGGFPAGTETREVGTPAAVEALESADLIISDSHIEMEWTKQPGARYVQTWHGTPLKRVHADILTQRPGHTERLQLDVDRWDVLLSPSPYGTAALRSAFTWSGSVLEIGLPRNDVLRSEAAGEIRRRVRQGLGIADGQTVVLYAPTFRDDVLADTGPQAETRVVLDAAALAGLGPDTVLLVRLHYLLRGQAVLPKHPAVQDVSGYPEIADLHLAADALVTDYSSSMVDFAVTGKPIVLYPYDLEHYRDEMRGLYVDLGEQAPGPLVRTAGELVHHLNDLGAVRREYAPAYDRFQRRYCPLDDGHATERFLERVVPSG